MVEPIKHLALVTTKVPPVPTPVTVLILIMKTLTAVIVVNQAIVAGIQTWKFVLTPNLTIVRARSVVLRLMETSVMKMILRPFVRRITTGMVARGTMTGVARINNRQTCSKVFSL